MNPNTSRSGKHALFILFTALTLTIILGTANASLLGSITADKQTLQENEIALIFVKITNDSDFDEKNVSLKVAGDDGLLLVENNEELPNVTKSIAALKKSEVKEFILKVKAVSSKNGNANIYAYFGTGTDLKQAVITPIEFKQGAITLTVNSKAQGIDMDTITIDYSIKNNLTTQLTNLSAELITPRGYDSVTPPGTQSILPSQGKMEGQFTARTPINANGEQKLVLAYGYFDGNIPHYFEKVTIVNLNKPNYPLITIVGIIVLVAAAYVLFSRNKKPEIKGTLEIGEEEEAPKKHKK